MAESHRHLVDAFFRAYQARDTEALRAVLAEGATWTFPGSHPLAGTHAGAEAIVAFFDAMGAAMGRAAPSVERIAAGEGPAHMVEVQRVRAGLPGGPQLDQELAVLWAFAGGRIASGRHLAADEGQLDAFFSALA